MLPVYCNLKVQSFSCTANAKFFGVSKGMGFQFAGIVPEIRLARVIFNVFVFESDRREKYKYWLLVCVVECVFTVAPAPSPIVFLIREHFVARSFASLPNTCSGYLNRGEALHRTICVNVFTG